LKATSKTILQLLFLAIFIATFAYFKHAYLYPNFVFWLGILFSPFIFRFLNLQGLSDLVSLVRNRNFIAAIFLIILLFFIRSSTAYYFMFAFSILFLIEMQKGKLNQLPIFVFIIISPIFQNLSNIWSFPIRLQLSELAAKSLQFLNMKAEAVGNIIYLNDMPFSVDPECTGLKMIGTGLILALLILAYFERQYERSFSFLEISAAFGMVMGATILANFTRLLLLVLFKILPENPLHEWLGLLSLIVYALLPFYFLIKFYAKWRWSKIKQMGNLLKSNKEIPNFQVKWKNKLSVCSILILYLFLLLHGFQFLEPKQTDDTFLEQTNLPNFQKSITENDILKFENDHALVYIKPPMRPFQGSHDPRICWQGSGYTFINIQPKMVEGTEIYTSLLVEKQDTLYTAWWYDNTKMKTISELEWRWQSLKASEAFFLINISCETTEDLQAEVKKLLLPSE